MERIGSGGKYLLNEEQRDWLRQWFPVTENRRLAKAMGTSESTMHRFARELHLTKSEKGLKAIKRRQAAHIKRVCEKNGWYDSLRGKPLSDECQEGTQRMWQQSIHVYPKYQLLV